MMCGHDAHWNSVCVTIPDGCSGDSGAVIGLDGATYSDECTAYWTGRVDVLCHLHGGPVCAVDEDKTYDSECDAVNAGVNAYSDGAC
jgi:hypothetical protein